MESKAFFKVSASSEIICDISTDLMEELQQLVLTVEGLAIDRIDILYILAVLWRTICKLCPNHELAKKIDFCPEFATLTDKILLKGSSI